MTSRLACQTLSAFAWIRKVIEIFVLFCALTLFRSFGKRYCKLVLQGKCVVQCRGSMSQRSGEIELFALCSCCFFFSLQRFIRLKLCLQSESIQRKQSGVVFHFKTFLCVNGCFWEEPCDFLLVIRLAKLKFCLLLRDWHTG
jgi:hypothetical protein